MKIQYQDQHLCIFESALYRTTSCLIATEDFILLIDPNWLPIEIKFIQARVEAIADNRPLYLLFTHSDYDHVLAYAAFPAAKVICSAACDQSPDKEKILNQIRSFDEEYYIKRDYPILFPKGEIIISAVHESRKIGTTTFHFYQAPGHTPDGLFTYIEDLELLIVGDYLSNIEFPFIYDHSEAYLKTLDLAEQLIEQKPLRLLVTGHGDHCTEQEEMKRRITESRAYINELKRSIEKGITFDLEKWLQRYGFAKALTGCHEENVEQLKKEKKGGRGKENS